VIVVTVTSGIGRLAELRDQSWHTKSRKGLAWIKAVKAITTVHGYDQYDHLDHTNLIGI
jgi:hypothetical protein